MWAPASIQGTYHYHTLVVYIFLEYKTWPAFVVHWEWLPNIFKALSSIPSITLLFSYTFLYLFRLIFSLYCLHTVTWTQFQRSLKYSGEEENRTTMPKVLQVLFLINKIKQTKPTSGLQNTLPRMLIYPVLVASRDELGIHFYLKSSKDIWGFVFPESIYFGPPKCWRFSAGIMFMHRGAFW